MTCPACSAPIASGAERCPACGAVVNPPLEGALAPDPLAVTPQARPRPEPIRELPGGRKRSERTWKDEVRDRVRHRRQERAEGRALPLFPDEDPQGVESEGGDPAEAAPEPEPASVPPEPGSGQPSSVELGEPEVDLPLRPLEVPLDAALDARRPSRPAPEPTEVDDGGWALEAEPGGAASPQRAAEDEAGEPGRRALAAGVDLGLMLAAGALVVYFAGRAARVELQGLLPSWPWLAGYLAGFGLAYATYFTGTTGQTLGKMVAGLRVVTAAGRPPGYGRALLRAALGALGVAAAFVGVAPVFFDPLRRAVHDRLLGTRVVRA